jgi:hypothetical protein
MLRHLDVYMIQCTLPDGTVRGTYLGCGDHQAEYKAKKHSPPPRMAADVATYQPYERYFRLTLIATCDTVTQMHRLEAYLIKTHGGKGTRGPGGYNTLNGHPKNSRQFHFLQTRGLLRSQRRQRPLKIVPQQH